ncbi:hypothetical protein ACKFKG_14290 [Phormidesmis sp. 146-35]
MEWLQAPLEFAKEFVKYILTAFVIYGVFMTIEQIRPAERHQPLRHIWFNLRWYVLYSAISLSLGAIWLYFCLLCVLILNCWKPMSISLIHPLIARSLRLAVAMIPKLIRPI